MLIPIHMPTPLPMPVPIPIPMPMPMPIPIPLPGAAAVEDGCKGHVPVFPNVPYEENKFNH